MKITIPVLTVQHCFQRTLIGLWLGACVPGSGFAAAQFPGASTETQVELLLAKAQTALREDRLTFPSGHNAVGYAQQILDLVPNQPEAQQILRKVVARYGRLSEASLDRAEALRLQEIQRAQKYHKRGLRVARTHSLSDESLALAKQRMDLAPQKPPRMPLTSGISDASAQAVIGDVVERYLILGEDALSKGVLEEAQHRFDVSRDLMAHYHLTGAEAGRLGRRLLSAGQLLAARKVARTQQHETTGIVATVSPPMKKERDIFLPPAF